MGAGQETQTAELARDAELCPENCVEIELAGQRRLYDVAAQGELVIGRAPDVTLTVDDERVSRRHLRISVRDGALYAEDLGSRNGTLLNGRRLEGGRSLRGRDELEVGPVRIRAGGAARAAGLLDEGRLIDRLDEEVERAREFNRPFAVIGIFLEGPSGAIDLAVARLVAQLGPSEVAGEYALRRILVLSPERTLASANARLSSARTLLEDVAGVRVSARAAAVPETATEADALVAVAFGSEDEAPASSESGSKLVVEDPRTRAVFETARRVARSAATVLVTGESGAGKEWVAAEIHATSPRAAKPFSRINCAALPETLMESELFGHEKGAFTGADRRRIGRIESADGGTVFLDEIGELPLPAQAKLLHVLEDRRVIRVGSNDAHAVDVRFIAATNRDLEREVRKGTFREDLYYRLSAIAIHVPPLRERPADLIPLAESFVALAAKSGGRRPPRIGDAFKTALETYAWPGNVRELKNVIERAVVLGEGSELTSRELPERLRSADGPAPPTGPMRQRVDDVERRTLEEALKETGGNRTHAAKKLGISRRGLIYKLHKLGLIPND
jgi:DNA-binding NtrC family response regulator